MQSLLGVPIVFRGQVVGDLYLTDKLGADAFSEEDQELLMLFASRVAVTIENARLYDAVRATRDELEARNRELEKQYQYAEDTNRIKSEFLANMSHELRTPLNAIIGFAELMHDGRAGPVSPEHKEYLGDILTSSRHLLQLINDILDLSKVESGKMEFRPEPVNLDLLAEGVRTILRTLAADKLIRVETDISPSLSDIVADPGRLKQILFNFLSNAIKFTPPGGRVKLDIRSEGQDTYRVEVRDTGAGIAAADLNKLFTDFRQLQPHRYRSRGTGLGLALTKRIVEAQGGTVGVESTPGQGSVFYAILPRDTSDLGEDPT
jgi:signal transduction histidine kinase